VAHADSVPAITHRKAIRRITLPGLFKTFLINFNKIDSLTGSKVNTIPDPDNFELNRIYFSEHIPLKNVLISEVLLTVNFM
jgi:hypothetical protein